MWPSKWQDDRLGTSQRDQHDLGSHVFDLFSIPARANEILWREWLSSMHSFPTYYVGRTAATGKNSSQQVARTVFFFLLPLCTTILPRESLLYPSSYNYEIETLHCTWLETRKALIFKHNILLSKIISVNKQLSRNLMASSCSIVERAK